MSSSHYCVVVILSVCICCLQFCYNKTIFVTPVLRQSKCWNNKSHLNSSVGKVIKWPRCRREIPEIAVICTASRPALGLTQSRRQWERGAIPKRTKRTGPETDLAALSVAEVTSAWSCTSTALCRFLALCCTKHKHVVALILWNCHIAYLPNTSVNTIFAHDYRRGWSGDGRLRGRISARRLAIYTDIFGVFSQSVHADVKIMFQIRVRQLISKSFPVHSSLTALLPDAM